MQHGIAQGQESGGGGGGGRHDVTLKGTVTTGEKPSLVVG